MSHPEAPEGRADAISPRIERGEVQEIRVERLVLVPEEAHAAESVEGADPIVRVLVDVPLIARRGVFRVGLLVPQKDPVTVAEDVGHMPRQRDVLLLEGRGIRPGGDGHVEREVGGLHVLRHVHMGDVERVAVLVEAVGGAVGGQAPLECDAGEVQEVAHGILIFPPREAAQGGAALAIEAGAVGGDEGPMQPFGHGRGGLGGGAPLLPGRHLPGGDALADLHPSGEGLRVGEVGLQRRQVEAALAALGVVAFEAVGLEEGRRAFLDGRGRDAADEQDRGEGPGERPDRRCHANSSPVMVPLDVENSPASIPRRCNIET